MSGKRKGLSSAVHVWYGRGGSARRTVTLNPTGSQKAQQDAHKRQLLASISQAQQELIHGADPSTTDGMDDLGGQDISLLPLLSAGDEADFESHASGEYQLCQELLQELVTPTKLDMRTRRDRVQLRNQAWEEQMEDLVDAYLGWQDGCEPSEPKGAEVHRIQVYAIEFFTTLSLAVTMDSGETYPNLALARRGYLGTAPRNPSIAIGFQVLEAYRQLHRVCPKLSIYGQVKALCHLHKQPFRRTLVEEFSMTFDVYLEILHHIDQRVNRTLRRDAPDWRVRNICPPCMYTLTGEPELPLSLLCEMDGNSSLKLVDSAIRAGAPCTDERTFRSDIWITPEEVDRFKDEVGSSDKAAPVDQDSDSNMEWVDVSTPMVLGNCVERWRSAAPEERKRMFPLFAVAGIFSSYCKHGHPLVACDMIRSGELRKYPLAIVNRLMDTFGKKIGLAYDVGCDLQKTLMNSSLGARARELELRLLVPAFHGHAHNRLCQLSWHPMYIDGVGKADFEGCKHAYSESNQLASGTRLSTPFHRHQAIKQHWAFRSLDKYAESGKLIFDNYKQALTIICQDGADLEVLSMTLGTTAKDYEQDIINERTYLQALKSEPAEVSLQLDYLELLQDLDEARRRASVASVAFQNLKHDIQSKSLKGAAITAVKNRYRNSWSKFERTEERVQTLEDQLGIEDRWSPGLREYDSAFEELTMRKYRLALDKLERLVVQRLLELSKLGEQGYKLREKIGKALRTRADAIRKTLDEYNKQAGLLKPPRQKLQWTQLVAMSTVGEFDLLRDARQDVRNFAWAHPPRRKATQLYFNVKRAHEEIVRCNLEACRLLTFMFDDHVDFYYAVSTNITCNPLLARELSSRWMERDRINTVLARRLAQLSRMPGFTGVLSVGQREGRNPQLAAGIPYPSWATVTTVNVDDDSGRDDTDDNVIEPLTWMAGGMWNDGDNTDAVDSFHSLHSICRNGSANDEEFTEARKILLETVLNVTTAMDRVSGSTTLLLHFDPNDLSQVTRGPMGINPEVYITPYLRKEIKNANIAITRIVQMFIETLAVPSLLRWERIMNASALPIHCYSNAPDILQYNYVCPPPLIPKPEPQASCLHIIPGRPMAALERAIRGSPPRRNVPTASDCNKKKKIAKQEEENREQQTELCQALERITALSGLVNDLQLERHVLEMVAAKKNPSSQAGSSKASTSSSTSTHRTAAIEALSRNTVDTVKRLKLPSAIHRRLFELYNSQVNALWFEDLMADGGITMKAAAALVKAMHADLDMVFDETLCIPAASK
ncbi:hypothetical protein EW026_g6755 [Hermanssonia centrifuga]|uniref:CxC1-like cysteine cluster associated with KDZ transposases domain-containing protein n=1 Tax=Hermanssonia centrifuga TaxID=98765 RepID=A0A4S4KED2_9APHY|nr:hypothetical protein EW026_g6755 [Hermanssonia centrifuga]